LKGARLSAAPKVASRVVQRFQRCGELRFVNRASAHEVGQFFMDINQPTLMKYHYPL
jgi:hypothetical protein